MASAQVQEKQLLLITGGNKGLGLETKALVGSDKVSNQDVKPYHIIVTSRILSSAEAAVETLHSLYPDSPSSLEALQLDVCDDESISRASEYLMKKFGRLDVLVNNAGILIPPSMLGPAPRGRFISLDNKGTRQRLITESRSIIRFPAQTRWLKHSRHIQQNLWHKRNWHSSPHQRIDASTACVIISTSALHYKRFIKL